MQKIIVMSLPPFEYNIIQEVKEEDQVVVLISEGTEEAKISDICEKAKFKTHGRSCGHKRKGLNHSLGSVYADREREVSFFFFFFYAPLPNHMKRPMSLVWNFFLLIRKMLSMHVCVEKRSVEGREAGTHMGTCGFLKQVKNNHVGETSLLHSALMQ